MVSFILYFLPIRHTVREDIVPFLSENIIFIVSDGFSCLFRVLYRKYIRNAVRRKKTTDMKKIRFTGRNYGRLLSLPCVLMVSKVLGGVVNADPHAVVRHKDGSYLLLECGDIILLNDISDEGCEIIKRKRR